MSKYLITGAAGFIGSALSKKLLNDNNQIITIDNLSTGIRKNVPSNCTFIEGNDYDENIINSLKNNHFDAIIHIAGQSSGEISFDNPVYDLQTNTQSTLMLLKLAKDIGCKKFIYASSMAIYGDHEDPLVNESTPLIPKSFYAVGKMASENYMRIYSKFGIQCTALRFFNVYGIGQNMSNLRQGMASIFLAQAIKNHHIVVKGTKDRFRDFVYIDDVVDAIIKSINREDGNLFESYNVCTQKKTTVEEVINNIITNLPYDVSVEYTNGTPGDQHGIYGDNTKIKNQLKWEPKVDFITGMKKMIEWAIKEEF